ncbi:MAG: hypothetical protein DRP08_04955 [Candidatus Aenigmatarchaeota archaeon]|nr:MAG: hypothetical protein DRP08_04955 [Candidatus Aenigmarchaeota archaeon]
MNFIKQIFEGRADDSLHYKFVRYGRGEFERLFFTIKKGKNLKIKTSWDFAADLFGLIAENTKEPLQVSGKIIANRDISEELPCPAEVSKRGKLYTAEINAELTPEELMEIYRKFQKNYILLNVKGSEFKLSVGKSLPKPGKAIKEDFCKATLPIELLDEFAFDFDKDFKEAKIVHIIKIDELIIPPELRNDPAKARLEAKRKGKIIRKITVDGKTVTHEKKLEL